MRGRMEALAHSWGEVGEVGEVEEVGAVGRAGEGQCEDRKEGEG